MKSNQFTKTIKTISIGLALGVASVGYAADTKVSGFADAQYDWQSLGGSNGFVIYDGAVYFNHEADAASVTVDLPFTAAAATGSFGFAGAKAQAYAWHKYDFGLSWKFGQFDHGWGHESNDSVNNFFARTGLILTDINKLTYTGTELTYKFTDNFAFAFTIANPNGATSIGTANYEYAGQFKYNMDAFTAEAGYAYNSTVGTTNTLLDINATMKAGNLDVGVTVDVITKLLQTQTGTAVGGDFVYHFNDTCGAGARIEYATNVNNINTQIAGVFGLKHMVTKALAGKLDYTLSSNTLVSGGTSTTGHQVDLAMVYAF